ncbi:hypothetical protein BO94DRAFT_562645 [Aspergillus sclerotioniger CBS 115572]|uniref:Major facilitator superfamily (MFS) profile domain-containing protein n=1 Tax=Aspergillus sclerotioniger CBS 115572 TaxID=1450535 RepID=A0A317X993_9EURO|nr:hypothetical protein BO94DRAFT_562645 [Aspergillus sclerotioniger CBS 115572]PWY94915.1 hypothetical protein BO94DRAFT_562645 [Aspergillus sclerotioniger CBS 115572]
MSAIIGTNQYIDSFDNSHGVRQGAINSALAVSSVVGSIMAGSISDKIGRRDSIMLACLWWLVGTAVQAGANSSTMACGNLLMYGAIGMAICHLVVGGVLSSGEYVPDGVDGSLNVLIRARGSKSHTVIPFSYLLIIIYALIWSLETRASGMWFIFLTNYRRPETCGKTIEEVEKLFSKGGPKAWHTKPGHSKMDGLIEEARGQKLHVTNLGLKADETKVEEDAAPPNSTAPQ